MTSNEHSNDAGEMNAESLAAPSLPPAPAPTPTPSQAEAPAQAAAPVPGRAADTGADGSEDGLMSRIDLIESQPLPQRATGFEQLHDELLAELQRGDHGA